MPFNLFSRPKTAKDKEILGKINGLEGQIAGLKDEEIKERSLALKERALSGEPLDGILPEAFALTRESAKRTLGQRQFDTQMLGGISLHKGAIVEMMTGREKNACRHGAGVP
jgi:preprotein translocase subunit SecA